MTLGALKPPSHQESVSTDGNGPQLFRRHAMPMLTVHVLLPMDETGDMTLGQQADACQSEGVDT